MNCRDTERLWNEWLDARDGARPDLEALIAAHNESCSACSAVSARFRTLQDALQSMTPPHPSPEFVERLRGLPHDSPSVLPFRRNPTVARIGWLSAAAALVIASVIGWQAGLFRGAAAKFHPPVVDVTSRSLSDAFADVTSATLDLAIETSGPAGRVGRVVLDSSTFPDAEPTLSLSVSVVPTSKILQSVSGRVGAGVRPLSGSARQAFGFLFRTATGEGHESIPAVPGRGT